MTRFAALVASVVAASTLVTCGNNHSTGPSVPSGSDHLVIRVEQRPSLPTPWDRVRIPEFSLYGDGRIIYSGSRKGTLLVAREVRLTSAETTRIYRQAYEAGLDQPRRLDAPDVLDAAQLVITVATPNGPSTTTVTIADRNGTDRSDIERFVQALPDGRSDATDYQPPALLAVANGPIGTEKIIPRPWPFATRLSAGVPTAVGVCTLLRNDLRQIESTARDARPETPWDNDGIAVAVTFRPLLPDESDCSALNR